MVNPREALLTIARAVPGARAIRDRVPAVRSVADRVAGRSAVSPASPPPTAATVQPPAAPELPPEMQAVVAEMDFTLPKTSTILVLGDRVPETVAGLRQAGFTSVTPGTIAGASDVADDHYRVVVHRGELLAGEMLTQVARVASTVVLLVPSDRLDDATAELERHGFVRREAKAVDGVENTTVTVLRRMEKQSTLHDFWRGNQPHGNTPQAYLRPIHRSRALHRMISDLPEDSRILEVGCNVGRNLAYLHDHGYPNVTGIEISSHAVALLRESYPQLAGSEVHLGPAGDVLPGFADDAFDLVYTMAVIEHLHPDEAAPVFDAMVRVAPHIVAIEPENRLSHRQYPHDVIAEFTSRGMTHVSTTPMVQAITDTYEAAMEDYRAYRFVRTTD